MAEPPSSPPGATASSEESIAWYKRQYEQLADELADFRESSHELEAELEKDLDAADKRQRELEQKAEALQFEVDEWKVRKGALYRDLTPLLKSLWSGDHQKPRGVADSVPPGEMQKGKGGGQLGAKRPGKGDHHTPRNQPDASAQIARHRGRQR